MSDMYLPAGAGGVNNPSNAKQTKIIKVKQRQKSAHAPDHH